MSYISHKINGKYRLMYDFGSGPEVIYQAYDEQDAIREKKRRIEQDNIYPVIFRSDLIEHSDQQCSNETPSSRR